MDQKTKVKRSEEEQLATSDADQDTLTQQVKKVSFNFSDLDEKVPELESGPDWSLFYTLEEKERFERAVYPIEKVVYSFMLQNTADLPPYTSWKKLMKKIFQHALNTALEGYKPNDMVQVVVQFIDTPLNTYLPPQRRDQLTGHRLFKKIQLIDYYDYISWGSSMKLTIIKVEVP